LLTEDKPVNILDHFKEIKKRLIRYFIFLTIFTVVSLIFFKQIIQIFIEPANKILLEAGADGQIVFGRVTEAWGAAARKV
jgi:Sec-independent protein translocase protein (TatC).